MTAFLETFPAPSAADFQQLESVLGRPLPDDLRRHYEASNGGRPKDNVFVSDDEYRINEFLPIKYGDKGSRLEDAYVDLVKGNEYFPKNVIPFASDGGGDYFCYCLDDDRLGNIIFYQSDYYDDPDRAVVWLSGSFDSFMKALVRSA